MFEDAYFKRKKCNKSKLLAYGFREVSDGYQFETDVLSGSFLLCLTVEASGQVRTKMTERETGEEYTLYKTQNAAGSFVGAVRSACENVLTDISEKCYDPDVFRSAQTKELIEYVRTRYHDELEFLWTKFPDNAVWRRKDTKKWYGILMTVPKRKLGLQTDEIVEIMDLRLPPERMQTVIDRKRYFPGWHMNKKSWYTVLLDQSVTTEELCKKIDESYQLAVN